MFNFTINYLGFLKFVPGLPHLFDAWLKIYTFITRPQLLDIMDEIEKHVSKWPKVTVTAHKYGGMQFNYRDKEVGHIHGNGLLDMILSRNIKRQLLPDGRIIDHHHFKNSGWISFYIRNESDKKYALELLRMSYERLNN